MLLADPAAGRIKANPLALTRTRTLTRTLTLTRTRTRARARTLIKAARAAATEALRELGAIVSAQPWFISQGEGVARSRRRDRP